jgi:hypothetical protein
MIEMLEAAVHGIEFWLGAGWMLLVIGGWKIGRWAARATHQE